MTFALFCRSSRLEQALNQKKVFVEEMKSRLKVTLSNLESTQESLVKSVYLGIVAGCCASYTAVILSDYI